MSQPMSGGRTQSRLVAGKHGRSVHASRPRQRGSRIAVWMCKGRVLVAGIVGGLRVNPVVWSGNTGPEGTMDAHNGLGMRQIGP